MHKQTASTAIAGPEGHRGGLKLGCRARSLETIRSTHPISIQRADATLTVRGCGSPRLVTAAPARIEMSYPAES